MSNESTFRAAIDELWNQKDTTALERYIAEDYVGRNPDGDITGRDGFAGLYETYSSAFPDCRIAINEVITEGDQVVAHYVFSGTHTGELLGITPSGNAVSVHGITIQRWADGQLAEERTIWDSLSLMKQVGAA